LAYLFLYIQILGVLPSSCEGFFLVLILSFEGLIVFFLLRFKYDLCKKCFEQDSSEGHRHYKRLKYMLIISLQMKKFECIFVLYPVECLSIIESKSVTIAVILVVQNERKRKELMTREVLCKKDHLNRQFC